MGNTRPGMGRAETEVQDNMYTAAQETALERVRDAERASVRRPAETEVQDAKAAVARAETEVQDAKAAVARAEAAVARAEAAVARDTQLVPMYTAAQNMYTAAQETLRTALEHVRDAERASVRRPAESSLSGDDPKRLKTEDVRVPFSDVVCDFELPFKGRDRLMETVAGFIDANFTSFASGGISKEEVQFIALEGLAGVGKTRFLLETKAGVEKELKWKTSGLADLHARGATAAVYMTFSGSAVGHAEPHFLTPAFVNICREKGKGAYSAGRTYMRASLVSHILYDKPWGRLPSGLQDDILKEDDLTSLRKVAAHVRDGLGAESNQMVALYLLVDESQQLGREVTRTGCSGHDFLRGMFAWIVTVMTTSAGNCLAKDCGMAFITLLGGTVLHVGGRYWVSDWLKRNITLPPLDLHSAMEVLRLGVKDDRFEGFRMQAQMLLEDCSCLPRLIRYAYSAWKHATESKLPAEDFIAYLRSRVTVQIQTWVDRITAGNRETVKRMVRLCLTGAILEKPGIGESTKEQEECFNGYVYAEELAGGVVYRSPMLLVHALGLRLGFPERIVALRPQAAVTEVLENGFLDILHARLCVFQGQTISVGDIFKGARGSAELLKTMLKVDAGGDAVVDEMYQFYSPKERWFYYERDKQMVGKDRMRYVHPTRASPVGAGVVFKCQKGTVATDGRTFQISVEGIVYEFWLQLKGQDDRVSLKEATGWAQVAHSEKFKVEGRKKVYVLCSRRGFSFVEPLEGDVLLLDLGDIMPEFLRRSNLGNS